MKHATEFFAFARERHAIHLKRAAGAPPPWTDDPLLRRYKFTNVFRELDRTTVWFREHIREPLRNDPCVLFATVAFRWFNKIETAEILTGKMTWYGSIPVNLFVEWRLEEAEERLRSAFPKGPYVNGAYVIKTPDGMDKLKGVLWCIENFRKHDHDRIFNWMVDPCSPDGDRNPYLELAWRQLNNVPYLGAFMAYEVVTDLRHTYLLEKTPDVMTWANPGPGACRGYGRVTGEGPDAYSRGNERHRKAVIAGMQGLLHLSRQHEHWPTDWPRWELRESEHTLCEWDKYERARLGEGRPKQLFRGGEP